MDAMVTLTLTGEVPDGVQVGDKLSVAGTVSVHSVTADLVDVGHPGVREFLPGQVTVEVYANHVGFSEVRDDRD